MNIWNRSWKITKLTFDVMKKDKELVMFPILGFVFSLIFILALIFPTIILGVISAGSSGYTSSGLDILAVFIVYFGLAVIATFFNVCVVYTTSVRLDGGDATLKDSLKFAFSKFGIITLWGLVAASVGIILRAIRNSGKNKGAVAQIASSAASSLLSMAWNVVTVFVVPVMVYKSLRPFKAIKESTLLLKKSWGEQLIRYFGLGFVEGIIGGVIFIFTLPFIILGFFTGNFIMALIFLGLLVILLVALNLIFGVANQVYNTALYVYANTGNIPQGFDEETMKSAFRSKQKLMPSF